MKPFCGYNFADYWQHWLKLGEQNSRMPKVFNVNWFRRDKDGRFLWPGFGDNLRVLEWIVARCEGKADAVETAIGALPAAGAINTDGLTLQDGDMDTLLSVDKAAWLQEMEAFSEYLEQFGERVPEQVRAELNRTRGRLRES